jgi:exonuclease V gamma subunit
LKNGSRSAGALLNDFFLPDSDTEAAMALIETQWQAIVDEGVNSHYTRRFHCRC